MTPSRRRTHSSCRRTDWRPDRARSSGDPRLASSACRATAKTTAYDRNISVCAVAMIPKYPKTPYWPFSPNLDTQLSGAAVHDDPAWFVGRDVVLSEKLDGGNTLIHRGQVYGRSVSEQSSRKWMAMVKKHTAWKVQEPDVFLFGKTSMRCIASSTVPSRRTGRFTHSPCARGIASRPSPTWNDSQPNAAFRWFLCCIGAVSTPWPPSPASWARRNGSRPSLVASGRGSCCVSRAVSRWTSSLATCARACVPTTLRHQTTGRVAGGPVVRRRP